jgi:hypothetical protein
LLYLINNYSFQRKQRWDFTWRVGMIGWFGY